jgi:Flp pilus assembly protein TadB
MQYIKVSHIVSHIPTMPAVYHHFGRFNQPPFLILGISGAEVGVLGLHTRVMIVMVATVMMVVMVVVVMVVVMVVMVVMIAMVVVVALVKPRKPRRTTKTSVNLRETMFKNEGDTVH